MDELKKEFNIYCTYLNDEIFKNFFFCFYRGQARTQIFCHHACAHLLLIALSPLLLILIMTAIEKCRNCAICSFSKCAPSSTNRHCEITNGRKNDKINFINI